MKHSLARPHVVNVCGKDVPVLPHVHSPEYFSDVEWFAGRLPILVGKHSFLEIGTGTGVIALFVALNGAEKIVATDINPDAVENARRTFEQHGLIIPVREGDVFTPIKADETFDVIFWNHPFLFSKTPRSMLERGVYDYQYESLRRFFEGARVHLSKNGEVLLGTSTHARLDLVRAFARRYGYRMTLVKQTRIPSRHRKGVKIDVRIYAFSVRA